MRSKASLNAFQICHEQTDCFYGFPKNRSMDSDLNIAEVTVRYFATAQCHLVKKVPSVICAVELIGVGPNSWSTKSLEFGDNGRI